MSVPPKVHKVMYRKGKCIVEYDNKIDRAKYTLDGLVYGALRDVGKFVCTKFKEAYYGHFKRRKGKVGRFTQYWVRRREMNLQVGIKPGGFYGGFQEKGTSKQPALNLLSDSVKNNIPKIVQIESEYLSSLSDEAAALARITEAQEETGGADG